MLGQKVGLQGGAKLLGRPSAHGTVDHQRWAVHPVGSAEDAGGKPTGQHPCSAVAPEFEPATAGERIRRKRNDDRGEHALHHTLMCAGQQQQAHGYPGQGRKQEPHRAAEVNVPPILRDHDGGNGDGEQHRHRRGHLERDHGGQQRNSNERFAKAEGGANDRRQKDDQQNVDGREVDGSSPVGARGG